MGDLRGFLIFIAILLTLADAAFCVYYFYIRKDITLTNRGIRNVLTITGIVMMVLLAIAYGTVLFRGKSTLAAAWGILSVSIAFCFATVWAWAQFDGMRSRNLELLGTLISVLEAGDSNMDGHSLHVHNLVVLLYDYLPREKKAGLSLINLRYAALLFDIGKYGVPGRILNKSGKLEGTEWQLMKRHPEICVKVLESVGGYAAISDWILYHHERVDGKGYYGLKGDEIPLASRMIALADTYSSITMARSYKPTLTYEDAKAELKLAAGTQLDASLVDIFCGIPMQRVEECMFDVMHRMGGYHEEIFGKHGKQE